MNPIRLALFSLFLFAAVAVVRAVEPSAKPNIIFILSDDIAQGDLGCYGQKLIQTPNIDRMASEGTRCTQTYCGTTVCAPSRTSLMIGKHMGHSPIRANRELNAEGQLPLPEGTFTVAQLLKSSGYKTACIGKWGMGMFDTTGSPLKLGFDHFFASGTRIRIFQSIFIKMTSDSSYQGTTATNELRAKGRFIPRTRSRRRR